MPSRRDVLAATALGLASVAGCLDRSGQDDEQVADAMDALPEPIGVEDPTFFVASDTDVAAIRDARGPLTEREGQVGQLARAFEGQVDVVDLADVERVAGVGAVDDESGAAFVAATVEGSFDVEAITGRIEEATPELEARTEGPFTWYAEPEEADDLTTGSAMFGISDRRIVFALGESIDVGTDELAGHVIDATTDPAGPLDDGDEDFAAVYESVSDHLNVSAASIDPAELDDQATTQPALQGLTALGMGTTPHSDGLSLEVLLRFRSAEEADADALAQLWAEQVVATSQDPIVDAIELEAGEGPTVRATAELDEATLRQSQAAPVLSLPVPWLAGTFLLGFGTTVSGGSFGGGGPAPPTVAWDFHERSDGRFEITHEAGDAVEAPVEVLYRAEGGERREVWEPAEPIVAGDTYTIEAAPETGTEIQLVWLGAEERAVIGQHTAT